MCIMIMCMYVHTSSRTIQVVHARYAGRSKLFLRLHGPLHHIQLI